MYFWTAFGSTKTKINRNSMKPCLLGFRHGSHRFRGFDSYIFSLQVQDLFLGEALVYRLGLDADPIRGW